jgi:hypothetical protein
MSENPLADHPLMECGCVATGYDGNSNPVCVAHVGIHPGARKVVARKPSLDERRSACVYCGREDRSDWTLAFFEYRPDCERDAHYDGCRGWD